ncbi:DNA-binding GntR family transcriptional regulator [Actinoplanes lutulentus]|uniref:GntR family transcriptional regulator n=1 Tax=Actinoplanes lutulentus TaxID=1287878 RepID=UPI000DB9FE96|nr:GntR family transcriptional regulator [Actinoplanes lutulentus]MBB2940692.1 DNA-binding GntR family transcriptional regulator [Actinoplanes lutulentus]
MTDEWGTRLAGDRALLDRGSTAERVADVLRQRITEGVFLPGTRLSEENLREALGISRNTLREAFRLLSHEGLLEHQLNRGVFVRLLTSEDIRDLYAIRRILECGALRNLPAVSVETIKTAIEAADEAAVRGDWSAVGTANMRFHQAIADLAGSRRVSEAVRALLAELRLVFLVLADPRLLHEPYVAVNRKLYELLAAGDAAAAEEALQRYFDDAEAQLLSAYATVNGAH